MGRITDQSKERIRDAIDMVDLVSARTDLRRAGVNRYEGLCPFHEERTPSFGIDPMKKVYYCFGCQAGGDAFSFVMETEGLDFEGALESLGDRYGVEVERTERDPRDAERRQRRERLLKLLDRTADFYSRVLWDAPEAAAAREYLAARGLSDEILRQFRVGYAPKRWDRVLVASQRAGYSVEDLLAAGLAKRSRDRDGVFDEFRGRITFPLADARGRVLGFGARAMRDDQRPKYVNTREGELYSKGRQLFGVDQARAAAARAGVAVVVEGYTDVLALHGAGIDNAVAIMGTAMTEAQVAELRRLAPTVRLALDADAAGQDAMVRAARLARARELDLRIVALPPGSDPADLVAADGPDSVRALFDGAVPFERFRVEQVLAAADLSSTEGRDEALAELRTTLGGLPAGIEREELVRRVASRLALPEALLASLGRESLPLQGTAGRAEGTRADDGRPVIAPGAGQRVLDRRARTERTFLALCVALPRDGVVALARMSDDVFTDAPARRVADLLRERLTERGLDDAPTGDAQLDALLTGVAARAERLDATPAGLELEALQLERARLEREMAVARADGRSELVALAEERGRVQERIDDALAASWRATESPA